MVRRITITFTLLGAALIVMVASILLSRAWALFVLPWVSIGLALVSLLWSLQRPRLDNLPESALPLVKHDEFYQRVLEKGYTSFAYQPGTNDWREDGDILLIFERLPWSYSRATWYCPPGYWALFADGTTRWLTIKDMAAAQRTDVDRRREIGWSVTPLTGTYNPPTTDTHRVSDTGGTP